MEEKVQHYLEEQQMIPDRKSPVIVGLSGGADSVALVTILHRLGYTCIPAHCNFQLRAAESDRDEQFVRQLTTTLQLPLEVIQFTTEEYAATHKISIEMAARELRYEWFEQLREKYSAVAIAVGHHADDTIETVLLNLIRGTGLKGLTGIQAINGSVIRPLLCLTRREILEYLAQQKLTYVEDSTNAENNYTRNKIRNQLRPLIETINPSFGATMQTTLQHLNEAYEFLQEQMGQLKQKLMNNTGTATVLSLKAFEETGKSPFVLYELLKEYGFNSSQVDDIYNALDATSGKLFYSDSYIVLKDRDQLFIRRLREENPGNTENLQLRLFQRTATTRIPTDPYCIHVDAAVLQFPLSVRPWQTGDQFYPLGMNHKKKLSDFLIDLKTDRFSKEAVRVVTDASGKVVWVVGLRIDNRFRITDKTTSIAELTMS